MSWTMFFKQLRGTLGTALVWGLAWGALSWLAIFALKLAHPPWAPSSRAFELQSIGRFAFCGAVGSLGFSSFVAARYRGRSLRDIAWPRFGMSSALHSAFSISTFMLLLRVAVHSDPSLRGILLDAISLRGMLVDALTGAVIGGASAVASLKLVQRAAVPGELMLRESAVAPELRTGHSSASDDRVRSDSRRADSAI